MRDKSKDIVVKELIAAATYSADNTPAAVDLVDAKDAMILLSIGAGGITFDSTDKVEFKLTHSNDNSTYTAVTKEDIAGVSSLTDGIIASLVAAHATAEVKKFGYVGGKRYIKLLADFSGSHATGTPIAACVVQADPYIKPV